MYTIGSKLKNYWPVWSPKGDLTAECLNIEDAREITIALNKQIPKEVTKGEYSNECDNYDMKCPVCNAFAGLLENEDGDGIYKYNLAFDWCPKCGQRLKLPVLLEG